MKEANWSMLFDLAGRIDVVDDWTKFSAELCKFIKWSPLNYRIAVFC